MGEPKLGELKFGQDWKEAFCRPWTLWGCRVWPPLWMQEVRLRWRFVGFGWWSADWYRRINGEREREKKKKLSVCWLFVIRLTLEYGHELTIEWESCTAILLETRWVSQIDFRIVTNHMDKAPAPVEMFKSLINAIWKPHRLVQDLFLLWCNLWAFWMQHISTIDQMHRQGTEPA